MFNKRKINITSDDTQEVEIIDTFIVSWKRMGGYSSNYPDIKPCYQAFTNYDDAVKFKKSIETAHKLIGNTINNEVNIEKQKSGLI